VTLLDRISCFMGDDETGFSLRLSRQPRRIALYGALDSRSAPLLVESAQHLAQQPPAHLELCLRGLTYLNFAGLDAAIHLYDAQRATGHQLVIVEVPDRLRRVFELGNCSWLLAHSGGESRPLSPAPRVPVRSARRAISSLDRRAIDQALRDMDSASRPPGGATATHNRSHEPI
jgi:anti-anti-sigma factor